jgi:hypothetical protein
MFGLVAILVDGALTEAHSQASPVGRTGQVAVRCQRRVGFAVGGAALVSWSQTHGHGRLTGLLGSPGSGGLGAILDFTSGDASVHGLGRRSPWSPCERSGSGSAPCLAGMFSCFGVPVRSSPLQVDQQWSIRSGGSTIPTSSRLRCRRSGGSRSLASIRARSVCLVWRS